MENLEENVESSVTCEVSDGMSQFQPKTV